MPDGMADDNGIVLIDALRQIGDGRPDRWIVLLPVAAPAGVVGQVGLRIRLFRFDLIQIGRQDFCGVFSQCPCIAGSGKDHHQGSAAVRAESQRHSMIAQ